MSYLSQGYEKIQRHGWFWVWVLAIIPLTYFKVGFYNFDAVKYVQIALTMQHQQQYILPYFHGVPYSDKGPMIFWLFILGWKVFGISYWWPQLLLLLCATATILVMLKLVKLLYPQNQTILHILPYILLGMPVWIASVAEIRVDVVLMFVCLLGVFSLCKIALEKRQFYWITYTFAITIGILCKGPVVLLYTFLIGLAFPFFITMTKNTLFAWSSKLILTTFIGMAMTLVWLIPAMKLGGHSYTQAILYGQISGRSSINDYSSDLYYFTRLPGLLMPWLLYLPLYYGYYLVFSTQRSLIFADKLIVLIILTSLIVFSFYGEKRLHYLMPDIPWFALFLARGIAEYIERQHPVKRWYQQFIGTSFLFFTGIILLWPHLNIHVDPRTQWELTFIFTHSRWIGSVLIICGLFYYFFKPRTYFTQILLIMLPFTFITVGFNVLNIFASNY